VIEYYVQIRSVHIACAIATGVLFAARGALVQAGYAALANHAVTRYLSYAIDTTLLTAALMLLTMLRLSPLATPWLAVKILLLLAYVVLGSYALRRARGERGRKACLIAALLCYGLMLGIARAHDPLGWWRFLGS
jgi:uncharacterized membrane protein SirB2